MVRLRKRVLDAVHELVPATLGDRVALGDRPRAPLLAHEPARDVGLLADLDAEAGARDLRPHVRLVPVHPAAAELDVGAVPLERPGAPAEAVARLEQQRVGSAQRRLARGGDAGEPATDDDDVVHPAELEPAAPLEVHEHEGDREHLQAEAEDEELGPA